MRVSIAAPAVWSRAIIGGNIANGSGNPAILLHRQKGKRGEGVSTLLIKNAKNIITMDKEISQFPGGSLYAEGQQILAIGTDLPYETADTVIDTLCIQASSTPITTCIRR